MQMKAATESSEGEIIIMNIEMRIRILFCLAFVFFHCTEVTNEPPDVRIVSPDSGAYVKRVVPIEIEVRDEDLASLSLYINDSLVHDFEVFNISNYRYFWNVESLQIGSTHMLYAYAADSSNNECYSDTNIVTVHPAGEVKWQLQLDGNVVSAPAITPDNVIIVGTTNHTVYAVDTAGNIVWTYSLPDTIGSAPTIARTGDIYIGTYSGLFVLDAQGQYQWEYPSIDCGSSSAAIASDNTIYIGASDSMLYAFNPDGSVKWQFLADNPVSTSPVIDIGGTVYIGTRGSSSQKFYAINPDGTEQWNYPIGSSINCTPAISNEGILYFTADNKSIYACNTDGNMMWIRPNFRTWLYSITIDDNGMLYTGAGSGSGGDCVYQISDRSIVQWTFIIDTGIFSSATICSDGSVCFPGGRGLYSIQQDKGTVRWWCGDIDSCCTAPTIDADGTIYIGNNQGILYAITGSAPPIQTAWPMLQHDVQHTGRMQ